MAVELMDDDYIAGVDLLDALPSTHAPQSELIGYQTLPGMEPSLNSDPLLFAVAFRVGTGADAEVRGAAGGSGDGMLGNPAMTFFRLTGTNGAESDRMEAYGTEFDLQPPEVPSLITLGQNEVTVYGVYAEALQNGAGEQQLEIRLYEKDPGVDDLLALETVAVQRTANSIRGCVEIVPDRVFGLTNTAGTVSGNRGSNEAGETPIVVLYQCDRGLGSENSPMVTVDVEQP